MKQVNWGKLNFTQAEQTIWAKLDDAHIKLDVDMVEALFGAKVATKAGMMILIFYFLLFIIICSSLHCNNFTMIRSYQYGQETHIYCTYWPEES